MCLRKSPQAETHKTDEITLEMTLLSVFHEFLFSLQPICISLRENVKAKKGAFRKSFVFTEVLFQNRFFVETFICHTLVLLVIFPVGLQLVERLQADGPLLAVSQLRAA